MPKNSHEKVETKNDFIQHIPTLSNAVANENYEPHTSANPYLDSILNVIDCMADKVFTCILHYLVCNLR